jgi:hypothetical protein
MLAGNALTKLRAAGVERVYGADDPLDGCRPHLRRFARRHGRTG